MREEHSRQSEGGVLCINRKGHEMWKRAKTSTMVERRDRQREERLPSDPANVSEYAETRS